MGTLKGILKMEGTFDGLSFYKLKNKIVVRKAGGFDGEKIKTAANYVRVRENSSEFAENARAGKYFRQSIISYLKLMRQTTLHSRVVSLFQELTKLDTVNPRGQRRMVQGLQDVQAAALLEAFEFDEAVPFSRLFPFETVVDWEQGTLTVSDYVLKALKKPKAATHLTLQFMVSGLDFVAQDTFAVTKSEVLSLDLTDTAVNGPLVLSSNVPAAPTTLGLLFVQYTQKVNAKEYVLKSCGLKIVGVKIS
jgi:hypothetical protein